MFFYAFVKDFYAFSMLLCFQALSRKSRKKTLNLYLKRPDVERILWFVCAFVTDFYAFSMLLCLFERFLEKGLKDH